MMRVTIASAYLLLSAAAGGGQALRSFATTPAIGLRIVPAAPYAVARSTSSDRRGPLEALVAMSSTPAIEALIDLWDELGWMEKFAVLQGLGAPARIQKFQGLLCEAGKAPEFRHSKDWEDWKG